MRYMKKMYKKPICEVNEMQLQTGVMLLDSGSNKEVGKETSSSITPP